MTRVKMSLVSVAAVLVLGACGPYRLQSPVPARPIAVAGFETVYGPEIPGDRQRLLDRMGVRNAMTLALRQSYPTAAGPVVRVVITQFRAGRWGPTRMHAVVDVLDGAGQVLAQFEVDATSVYGSRDAKIRAVAQECVNQIAARL